MNNERTDTATATLAQCNAVQYDSPAINNGSVRFAQTHTFTHTLLLYGLIIGTPCTPQIRTATNSWSIKCHKIVSQFPKAQSDIFKLLV